MNGSLDPAFKLRLKQLIVKEADKDIDPGSIADDAVLFGPDSAVQLDSIDALQISMAIHLQFGVRVEDPKQVRRIMASINTLADFLQPA
ncbi:MAG TPA: acyl carrier protein [Stenotrophobium sp.]|jgi:acyl carrier protein|nr:acyl carrier protein [Stenotrophobium sp.]